MKELDRGFAFDWPASAKVLGAPVRDSFCERALFTRARDNAREGFQQLPAIVRVSATPPKTCASAREEVCKGRARARESTSIVEQKSQRVFAIAHFNDLVFRAKCRNLRCWRGAEFRV